MSRNQPVRPSVEVLEAREVPALGLDPTFGAGGIALNPLAGTRFVAVTATAVLPTGETLIVGTTAGDSHSNYGELAIARLNANGTADPRFGGGDGFATFALVPYVPTPAVTLQADGKILIAGTVFGSVQSPVWDAFVVRLNADGTPDASFGTGGQTVIDFGGTDWANRIAVQPDGKIVIAGSTAPDSEPLLPPYEPPASSVVVQRLNANGTADTTFGPGGRAVVAESGSWTSAGLAIQPDGKLVVSGHVTPRYWDSISGAMTEFAVRRFNANGTTDSSFGTAGRAATTYGAFNYAYANDMVLLGDGRIVVGGASSYGQGLLAWFGSNGAVVSQEQFSDADGGLSYITRVVAMPRGGVMATNGSEFEYHAAPGVSEDVIEVHAGPRFGPGAVALGSGGQLVVAGASFESSSPFDPSAYRGAPGAYRLTDPGVTASNKTFVVWNTPPEVWGGTATLMANVVPVLGSEVTEGTITFREGSTVLGTVDVGALSPNPWIPPGPYPPVVDAPPFVTVNLAPGDHTITAEYSGTARWAASSATAVFHVPETIAATTTLTVSNAAPTVGESVTLSATVARADGTGYPFGGLVTFYDGATILGAAVPMLNGAASLVTPPLTAGTHSFRAVFAGDGYASAESATVKVAVTAPKVTTSTTLTAAAPAPVVGAPFTLTARVRGSGGTVAGGTVTFTDGTTVLGTAPVVNGVATLTTTSLRIGARTLRAAYSGDAGALASNSPPVSVTVGKAPTATSLALSTRTFVPGQVIELIASVRITAGSAFPVGAVEFRDGARVLGTGYLDGRGQARYSFAATAGAHALTAVYLGASTCATSTSAPLVLTVGGRAATTTALNVAVAAPVFGQPQTLTARVTGATAGRVDFFDGQVLVGSAAVNGSGVASLTFASNLGARRYRAVFAGTDAADTSASGWTSLTVAKATPTVTVTVGTDGTVRATVRAPFAGSPIGTVTFKAGNTILGTASVDGNGVATFRTAGRLAGAVRIAAAYSGSSCFLGAISDPFDIRV